MEEIRQRLGDSCIDFSEEADARNENLAMCDEKVLETYLEKGTVTDEQVCRMITGRKVFPCFFGSAEIDRGAGVVGRHCKMDRREAVSGDIRGQSI